MGIVNYVYKNSVEFCDYVTANIFIARRVA